jgi:membrane-associated phospholipid phosphatase
MPAVRQSLAAAAAAATGLALLAAAVVTGKLQSVDQYAVDHWMRGLEPRSEPAATISWHQFYPRLGDALEIFCNLWTYPASAFVSFLVLAGCCLVLLGRERPRAALAWAAAWVAGNVLEALLKHLLERPGLHAEVSWGRLELGSFGHAFPSGHAMRAVLVAAVLAAVWRSALWPASLWAAVVVPALVVSAAHTPTDVAGGALLGLAAVFAVKAIVKVA